MPSFEEVTRSWMNAAERQTIRRGFELGEEVRPKFEEMLNTGASRVFEFADAKFADAKGPDRERYIIVQQHIGAVSVTLFVDEMIAQRLHEHPDFTASHPWRLNTTIFDRAKELLCPFFFFC